MAGRSRITDEGLQDLMHFAFHRAFWEGGWLLPPADARARMLEIAYEAVAVERLGRRQRRKLATLAEAYAEKLALRSPI